MPPVKKLRTYGPSTTINSSVDAFNALFVKNMAQRIAKKRRKKYSVKELSTQAKRMLSDDSLQVSTEDTFDKLRNGPVYNRATATDPVFSPLMTRQRKKNVSSEIHSNSSSVDATNNFSMESRKDKLKASEARAGLSVNSSFSPMMTRQRKKKSNSFKTPNVSDLFGNRFKDPTVIQLDSLEVEVELQKPEQSSSYLVVPSVVKDASKAEVSFNSIFTKSFQDKQRIHCSTPLAAAAKKIVLQAISPIKNASSLIKQSYNELMKWDSQFPSSKTDDAPQNRQSVYMSFRHRNIRKLTRSAPSLSHKILDTGGTSASLSYSESDFESFASRMNNTRSYNAVNTAASNNNGTSVNQEDFDLSTAANCDNLIEVSCNHFVTKRRKIREENSTGISRTDSFSEQSQKIDTAKKLVVTIPKLPELEQKLAPARTNKSYESSLDEFEKFFTEHIFEESGDNVSGEPDRVCVSRQPSSFERTDETETSLLCENLPPNISNGCVQNGSKTADLRESALEVAHVVNDLVINVTKNEYQNADDSCESVEHQDYLVVEMTQNDYTGRREVDVTHTDFLNSNDVIEGSYEEPQFRNFAIGINKCAEIDQHSTENVNLKDEKLGILTQDSFIDLTDSVSDLPQAMDFSQAERSVFAVPCLPRKTLLLKPGKLWRRSLLMVRNSNVLRQLKTDPSVATQFNLSRASQILRRTSIRVAPAESPAAIADKGRRTSLLQSYAINTSYVPDVLGQNLENSLRGLSLIEEQDFGLEDSSPVTAREVVLRKCGQLEPEPFQTCYPDKIFKNCQKIGEGVYGEVFLFRNPEGGTSVIKIIPIEGDLIVNGERQKKYEEILSEICIATELSNLRHNPYNRTAAFNEVQKIKCTRGCYPEKLLDLWNLYDETSGSENDSPEIFSSDQLYVILQLANGGKDLESYIFNNAVQVYAMMEQVAFALAVAESQLNFEHRDLHWGNILLSTVEKNKTVTYLLNGKTYEVETRGVEATIIDFTLSRVEYDGVVFFNDLGVDEELFTGDGDYQFEIYRMMQEKNGNNWQTFEPYSNLLWLRYTLDKAVTGALRYKNTQSKIHKDYTAKLKYLYSTILDYKSVSDFVLNYLA